MIGMFDVGMCWSIFLRKLKLVLFSHHPAPMLQAQRFSGQLCTSASESLRSFSLPLCSLVSRFSEHIGQLMNWKLPNHDQILLLWMIQEQDLCFSKPIHTMDQKKMDLLHILSQTLNTLKHWWRKKALMGYKYRLLLENLFKFCQSLVRH